MVLTLHHKTRTWTDSTSKIHIYIAVTHQMLIVNLGVKILDHLFIYKHTHRSCYVWFLVFLEWAAPLIGSFPKKACYNCYIYVYSSSVHKGASDYNLWEKQQSKKQTQGLAICQFSTLKWCYGLYIDLTGVW